MTPQPAAGQGVKETYELLLRAAARRQPVAAMYDGQPRLLCPHVLGRKSGRLHVLFYQFGGSSNSGLTVAPEGVGDWRCLAVEKLSQVEPSRRHGALNNAPGGRPALMKWISMSTLSLKKIHSRGNATVVAIADAPE
jgi:hypothetical protein